MPTKQYINDEISFHSDRLSTQVRMVSLGIIVTVWGFLISRPQPDFIADVNPETHLKLIGFIALVAMFFDFLQYIFGYLSNSHLLDKMEDEDKQEIKYNYSDWKHRWQTYCFIVKIILTFISFIYFVITILNNLS